MIIQSLFFVLLLLLPFPALAQSLTGRVVAIADGDTLTVLTDTKQQIKIRINGIDAPEKGQAFGQASKEHLSRLVFDQVVRVESNKRDRYGRTVGKVLVQGRERNHKRAPECHFPPTLKVFPYSGTKTAGCITVRAAPVTLVSRLRIEFLFERSERRKRRDTEEPGIAPKVLLCPSQS